MTPATLEGRFATLTLAALARAPWHTMWTTREANHKFAEVWKAVRAEPFDRLRTGSAQGERIVTRILAQLAITLATARAFEWFISYPVLHYVR
jgi:hypothetical protein